MLGLDSEEKGSKDSSRSDSPNATLFPEVFRTGCRVLFSWNTIVGDRQIQFTDQGAAATVGLA